jgi:hypothetical protein
MNAITIIEAAPSATPQEDWINRGRDIAHRKVALDWDMAEWIAEGVRDGHAKQLGFNFADLGHELGIKTPHLKAACKVAQTFPPSLRHPDLSVEHHAAIVSLPKEEALPLLVRASREKLQAQDLREIVTQRRYDTLANFEDDDLDGTLATLAIRQWNRCTPEARELAYERFEIAAKHGFTMIDEDEVDDDEA